MFTFVHLSDPHLAPVPVPYPWQMFNKRFTTYLSWLLRNRHIHQTRQLEAMLEDIRRFAPDHIAITGDITNVALPAEFIAARRWLEGIGPPADVTVIPGNHDACVAVEWRHSLAHWAKFMSGNLAVNGHDILPASTDDFPFIRRRGPAAFIGLTSAIPRPITGTPAAGWLGPGQIERLKDALAKLGHEGLFRVVLIHHAPHPGLSIRKALLDARQFAEALAEAGAELVLHGHLHQSDFEEMVSPSGVIPVIGAPSASIEPHPARVSARYHVCRLTGGRGSWRLEIEVREALPKVEGFRTERKFHLDIGQGGMQHPASNIAMSRANR